MIIEGKNLVGISGSVVVTPSWLSPAHQELDRDLPLKTTGHTTTSLTGEPLLGAWISEEGWAAGLRAPPWLSIT